MFYSKTLLTKKPKYKRIAVNFNGNVNSVFDDISQPLNVAKCCYNVSANNGALTNTMGLNELQLKNNSNILCPIGVSGKTILRCFYFHKNDYANNTNDDRLIFYCSDKKFYQIFLNNSDLVATELSGIIFNGIPTAINYKLNDVDVLLLSSVDDDLTVYDGTNAPYVVSQAPRISSMCIHYERLFATSNNNTLWFSDDLDPTNWNVTLDQAGYIDFTDEKGKLYKVISFLDYLFIFRQYGITRLTAYALQEEFYANQLYTTSGEIYPNTVAVCGDIIFFLCSDGLYSFDGINTKRILTNLDKMLTNVDKTQATATYSNGKYILATKLDFLDEETKLCPQSISNAVITLDINTNQVNILRGLDILHLESVFSDKFNGVLACVNGKNADKIGSFVENNGQYFGEILPKNWICPETDLGSTLDCKYLKYASVFTKYPITLMLDVDNVWHYFDVDASDCYQKIPINVSGKLMRLVVSSVDKDIFVRPIELTFVRY